MEVNKKAIKRWVKALRSGRYKQGRGQLRSSDNKYCCLGVLCNVYKSSKAGVGSKWEKTSDDATAYVFMEKVGVLPELVVDWVGLPARDPILANEAGLLRAASDCNDGQRDHEHLSRWVRRPLTFKQIADLIEKKYLS